MGEKEGRMNEWQPIETAPKDGTKVLGFGSGTDRGVWPADKKMPEMMCVIYWSWHEVDDFEDAGEGLFKKVKKIALEMWQPHGPHFFKPTHWMPLPEPPAP